MEEFIVNYNEENVVEAEYEEVTEDMSVTEESTNESEGWSTSEPVAETQEFIPLVVRIHLVKGNSIDVTVQSYDRNGFRSWVAQVVAKQIETEGLFIGNAFIPSTNIRYYENI